MSVRLGVKIAALASIGWMSIGAALAESRVALVIGNANYAVSPRPNPANDAKAMAKFLSAAGFQVLQAPDLRQAEMLRTIGNFAALVAEKGPDTVALVFYAGHGLQVDGENYLVPVDASIQREADVPLQAMRLADLMNALSSVPLKARIVILDACRNNPFSTINRTTGRGLAIVDAPNGSLVSYSTAPGTEALDGDGPNSPYTAALLKVGREQGLPIEQALKRVRLAVNEATGKQQVPWESSSLTSEFSFFPRETATAGAPIAAGKTVASGAAEGRVRSVEAWQNELKAQPPRAAYATVIREDRLEAYQAYLALYPSDPLAAVVRKIVERRQEMIAWQDAVAANTTASYQAFLAGHGDSDLATTAKRLVERPHQKRALTRSSTPTTGLGPSDPVGAPLVTPIPVYRPVHIPFRDKWRFSHRGEGHKPMKSFKLAKPSRFATRSSARSFGRNVKFSRRIRMGRSMMGRGMFMRPSFGRMGFMGGGRMGFMGGGRRFF